MVPGLLEPASSGHLERQIFRPHPRPTESESLGVAPVVCFLQVFLVALRPTGLKGTGDINSQMQNVAFIRTLNQTSCLKKNYKIMMQSGQCIY